MSRTTVGSKAVNTVDITQQKSVMRTFPKVELHRHLEGTFALKTLHRIAMANGLDYSANFQEFKKAVQFPREAQPDFLLFLSKFKNDWYRSYQDIHDITFDSVRHLADDGLFYVELRFSPEHFALHNKFDRLEVTRLIVDAANAGAKSAGIAIRYLITFNRAKQSADEMIALYSAIRDLQIPGIVGIDLAGDETHYPPKQFSTFFDVVSGDGIYRSTIHAGEVSPPSQIWDSLKHLHANRIGHGTSATNDPELQARLIDTNTVLEQCLTSNYQTGSWVDEKNHPMGRLYRAGVPVTINSDDPTIQDTDLTDDYVKACRYFKLSVSDLVQMNLTAISGSFVTEKERATLVAKYKAAVSKFGAAHGLDALAPAV